MRVVAAWADAGMQKRKKARSSSTESDRGGLLHGAADLI
jgi:hypothetical protein